MKNIWENAPEEATHYQPAQSNNENEVYFKITDCHVESAWIPVHNEFKMDFPVEGDYYRLDYDWDDQPEVSWFSLIVRETDHKKGGSKYLSVDEFNSVKVDASLTSLARWLLDKAGDSSSDVDLGLLTISQVMQIAKELEQEDQYHSFAITLYSDNSAYVQRRNYYGEESDGDQYIFGFTLKEEK